MRSEIQTILLAPLRVPPVVTGTTRIIYSSYLE
jgi:ABC-type molybdate transport system permease subunit